MALVLIDVQLNYLKPRSFPTRDVNIPLTSVQVQGDIIDFVGKIKVSQTYINRYPRNIEATYMFNLDNNSTVTGMSMVIGDRVLVSQIDEKTLARQTYETAISEKKTTCLLEKATNGIYTMNVGNILPGQEVKIEFEYLTSLECTEDGQMKFVLPTNISPKYDDGKKTVTDMIATRATTSSMGTSTIAAPFKFHLDLNWRSNNEIMEVKSLTNEIEVSGTARGVNIKSVTAPSNGDFNVLVTSAVQPTVYVHTKGESTYVMVNQRVPDEYHDLEGGDYTIVVDRSGSMGDALDKWSGNSGNAKKTKMDYAREATELFVQSLPAGSKFNVVSFGSTYQSLFPTTVEYTEETKRTALSQISQFGANMGGTELFQCLSDVLSGEGGRKSTVGAPAVNLAKRVWTPSGGGGSSLPDSSNNKRKVRERIVILMTDGDVGNVDAVTSMIRQYNHCSRVFTIGIGQDVNRALVEKIAKASNACSEVLIDNPDISTVVAKMLDASTKSFYKNMCLNVVFDEGGMLRKDVINVNKVVYPNQFVSFYHKFSTREFLTCSSIQLCCRNGITDEMRSWNFPMNHAEDSSQENALIPQLYAADYIAGLEETNVNNNNMSEIIRMSIDYNIMNARTSFVVVDELTKRTGQYDTFVRVSPPVQVNSWGGAPGGTTTTTTSTTVRFSNSRNFSSSPPNAQACFAPQSAAAPMPQSNNLFGFANFGSSFGGAKKGSAGPPPPPAPAPPAAMFSAPSMVHTSAVSWRTEAPMKTYESARSNKALSLQPQPECDLMDICEERSAPLPPAAPAAQALDLLSADPFALYGSIAQPNNNNNNNSKTSTQKMDELLQFKKVDGSFSYHAQALSVLGWSSASISSFAASQAISEEMAFNLCILKFLRSDELRANKKYVMIVRNLERWLNGQELVSVRGNQLENVLVLVPAF